MQLYLAGPLFTAADREFVDRLADRLEAAGHACFVPHRQTFEPFDAPTIFAVDSAGLHGAEAMVAWLDGPMIDDGTACEIGMFHALVQSDPSKRGIVGLLTDMRGWRGESTGLNLFVRGAIEDVGAVVTTFDDALEVLRGWR